MDNIQSAYKALGKTSFYDGMITCSTFSGKVITRVIWDMNKKENEEYIKKALSAIPDRFEGKLLEVPVGTGILTMPVYNGLKDADITCLDYSAEMMGQAEKRAEALSVDNVKFRQGDVGALPFKDNEFDIVLSLNGFHAFPDKEAAYGETYRILKKGGIFSGCFYIAGENKRTDWFINNLYTPKGYFTPPYETKGSLVKKLESMYEKVSIETFKSMACFRCVK